MKKVVTRRHFAKAGGSLALLALAGCTTANTSGKRLSANAVPKSSREFGRLYGARPDELFPIPAVKEGSIPPKFWRRRVSYKTDEKPGTVVVDTKNFYLYHVEEGGKAMRYGIGIGRAGFEWSGRAHIKWKQHWPKWFPPKEMIEREPELAQWSAENGGMPAGLQNPLGARALYIFEGNVDTLYRVHGSNGVKSIGTAVSSGCVRMVNQDVIDLHDRVEDGSAILVV